MGAVQGSVLGLLLYAIFVSPLLDLTKITCFAGDNFVIKWNKSIDDLIDDLEKELEMIIKWLKDLGLMVNTDKTEISLFNRNDLPTTNTNIMSQQIANKKSMNVLVAIFDANHNWQVQISNVIKKANSTTALFVHYE
jgi:hypothetical protein